MAPPKIDKETRELHKVYDSENPEQTAAIYDGWSTDYEAHMSAVGYSHPTMVATMLQRHQAPDGSPLLDAGCGTGVLGELLIADGYREISGFDASEGMLAYAVEKGIYKDLKRGLLGARLDYPDNAFGAAVAAGVFTQGHAPLDGLDELVRVTRPGGHVVFSIARTYLGEAFESKAAALEAAGRWRRVEASELYDSTPVGDDVVMAQVMACVVA